MTAASSDRESQNRATGLGGRNNIERLRVPVAVASPDWRQSLIVCREADSGSLLEVGINAGQALGFKITGSETRVPGPYSARSSPAAVSPPGMLLDQESASFRLGRDNLATARLIEPRLVDCRAGVDAFRAGDRGAPATFYRRDVEIEGKLHQVGWEDGLAFTHSRLGTKVEVAVPWQVDDTLCLENLE